MNNRNLHNILLHFRTRLDTMSLVSPRFDQQKAFIWFDINALPFFSVYKVEGVSPDNPDEDLIVFEVNSAYLASSLGGIRKTAKFVEIKLQKDVCPVFAINMKLETALNQEKDATHQVPVVIVPRLEWTNFLPPYDSIPFDFHAKCPRLSVFKRSIDTFKYSNKIRIVLRKRDSTMSIEAESDTTKNFTIFSNIQIENYLDNNSKEKTVSASIDQKSIAMWLHHINTIFQCQIYCLIQNNRSLKLSFRNNDEIIANFVQGAEYQEDEDQESEDDEL